MKTSVTIETIRQHRFVGNAFNDGPAFDAIVAFAANNSNPTNERAEALRIMARKGMGLKGEHAGDNLTDEQLVNEFMEERGE